MELKHKHRLTALIGFTLVVMGAAAHADQTCSVSTSGLTCTPAGPTVGCVVTPQGVTVCGDKPLMLNIVVDAGSQSQSAINVTHLAKQLGFGVMPETDGRQVQGLTNSPLASTSAYRGPGVRLGNFQSLTYAETVGRAGMASG
jgi:hypothetical protein